MYAQIIAMVALLLAGCAKNESPTRGTSPGAIDTTHAPLSLQGEPIIRSEALSVPAGGRTVTLGQGWDYRTGSPRALCVIGDTTSDAAQHVDYRYEAADQQTELRQALQLGVEASLGLGIFSGSAETQILSSSDYDGLRSSLVIVERVQNSGSRFKDLKLAPVATEAIRDRDFNSKCGDRFIVGIQTGGELFARISVQSDTHADESAVKANISASVPLFASGGSAFANQMKTVIGNRTVTYEYHSDASNGTVPSMDSLVAVSQRFPTLVSAKPRQLLVQFSDYGVVKGPSPTYVTDRDRYLGRVRDALEDVEDRKAALLTSLNADGGGDNTAALNGDLAIVTELIRTLNDAASSCYEGTVGGCRRMPAIALPNRIEVPANSSAESFVGAGPMTIDAAVGKWRTAPSVPFVSAKGTQGAAQWRSGVSAEAAAFELRDGSGNSKWVAWTGQPIVVSAGTQVFVVFNDGTDPNCYGLNRSCYDDNEGAITIWFH